MGKSAPRSRFNVSYLNTSVLKFKPQLPDPGFGSDVVILDLEDGVHFSAKSKARDVLAKLDLCGLARKDLVLGIRINSLSSIDGVRDIDMIHSRFEAGSFPIDFVQIPKVRTHYDVLLCKSLFEKLPNDVKLIPIIETPEAIENVERIAEASDAMMFGQVDIVASMYQKNDSYLAYARGRFCVACAQSGISAIDTAKIDENINLTDMTTFETECGTNKAEGFTAKAVIHPAQVQIVNKLFRVSDLELDKYRALIKNYEESSEGFSLVDGLVVAPPFVARAKMLLRLYSAKEQIPTEKA